jgi:hypothetical protein
MQDLLDLFVLFVYIKIYFILYYFYFLKENIYLSLASLAYNDTDVLNHARPCIFLIDTLHTLYYMTFIPQYQSHNQVLFL